MATVRIEIREGIVGPFAPHTTIEVRRSSTAAALTIALASALAQTHLGFAELLHAVRRLGYIDPAQRMAVDVPDPPASAGPDPVAGGGPEPSEPS